MIFTHIIFLLGSNVGRYPQNKEWVPLNNPNQKHEFITAPTKWVRLRYMPYPLANRIKTHGIKDK